MAMLLPHCKKNLQFFNFFCYFQIKVLFTPSPNPFCLVDALDEKIDFLRWENDFETPDILLNTFRLKILHSSCPLCCKICPGYGSTSIQPNLTLGAGALNITSAE